MPTKSMKSDSNQQMILDLIREISGQANLLTIPKIFINLTGDIKTALFLSQCIYWGDRSSTGDGWFYKLTDDWREDIGLSYHEVVRIRKDLISRNFLQYEIHQNPQHGNEPLGFYRVNFDCLYKIIEDFIRGCREKRDTRLAKSATPVSRFSRDGVTETARRSREKREMLNKVNTEPTSEPTTEPTSSSSDESIDDQEVEVEVTNEIQISESLLSALEEVDVFESLYAEIVASGWTEDQLLELVRRVKKSNTENPGAIFMWRLRNQKPPRAAWTTTPDYAMAAEISDEAEIPDEVYDAWEKTLSEVSLKVSSADYSTWIEPLSITGYNGSLVLHAANPMVLDHLKLLGLNGKELGILFSNHLGQKVPVVFG